MIIEPIGDVFGRIMYFCYEITHHYGLTIILFTLVTKIILLPVSIMVQKNSIKMVRIYCCGAYGLWFTDRNRKRSRFRTDTIGGLSG